jgi:hypothetical protein
MNGGTMPVRRSASQEKPIECGMSAGEIAVSEPANQVGATETECLGLVEDESAERIAVFAMAGLDDRRHSGTASVRVVVPEKAPLPSRVTACDPFGSLGLLTRPKLTLKSRDGDETSSPQTDNNTLREVIFGSL